MRQLKKLFAGRRDTPLPEHYEELVEDNFVSYYVLEGIANFLVEQNPNELPKGFIRDTLDRLRHGNVPRMTLDEKVNEKFNDTEFSETTQEAIREVAWDVYTTLDTQGVFDLHLIGDSTIPILSRLPPNGTLRRKIKEYFEHPFTHTKPVYHDLVRALEMEESEFNEEDEKNTVTPSEQLSIGQPSSEYQILTAITSIKDKIPRTFPLRPVAHAVLIGACALFPATQASNAGTSIDQYVEKIVEIQAPPVPAAAADPDPRVACEGRVTFQMDAPTYRQLRQRSTTDMFEDPEQYRRLISQIVDCAAENGGEVYLSAYANLEERDRLQSGSRRLEAFIRLRGQVVVEDIQREAESRDLQVSIMMDPRGRTDAFGDAEQNSTVVFSTLRYTPDVEGVDTHPAEIEWQRSMISGTIRRTPRRQRLAMLSPSGHEELLARPHSPEYTIDNDTEYPAQPGAAVAIAPAHIPTSGETDVSSIDIQRMLARAESIVQRCQGVDTPECAGLNISIGEETVVETGREPEIVAAYEPIRMPAIPQVEEPAQTYIADEVEQPQPADRMPASGMVLASYIIPPGRGDTLTLLRDDGTAVTPDYEQQAEEPASPDSVEHLAEPGGFQRHNPFAPTDTLVRDNPFDDGPSIDAELPASAGEAELSQRILQLRGAYVGVSRQVAELVGRSSCASVSSLITDYFEMQEDLDANPEISGSSRRALVRSEQRAELTERLEQTTARLHEPEMQSCLLEYRRVIRAVIQYENQVNLVYEAVQELMGGDDETPAREGPLLRSADDLQTITGTLIAPIDLRYNEEFVDSVELFR